MKSAPAKRGPAVIRVRHRRLQQSLDCDVAVCGGTLGLLLALALQASTIMSAEVSKFCGLDKRNRRILTLRGGHMSLPAH